MDFTFTTEQLAIHRSIKELCNDAFNAQAHANDAQNRFARNLWEKCGELGICGLPIAKEYGGTGYDMLTTASAIQALGRHCHDEGLIFSLCAHICTCLIPIGHFGTADQKQRYLPELSSGVSIGGNGITEADAGSEPAAMGTQVVPEEDGFVINGAKLFVTNAPVADVLLIYAKHPNGMKMMDVSCFIIDMNTPGIQIGQTYEKMGLCSSPLSEVILKDCRVKREHLLGRERLGMMVFNHSMLWERIVMSAYHVGAMEQQYDQALAYSGARSQFGRKIKKHARISDKLVDMKMRLAASRLMLYHACWKYDQNQADLSDAAMLKLLCSESKVKNSLDAVQIFGAYGYMKESAAERQLRNSVAATLYSGTSEIQRKIIGEQL